MGGGSTARPHPRSPWLPPLARQCPQAQAALPELWLHAVFMCSVAGTGPRAGRAGVCTLSCLFSVTQTRWGATSALWLVPGLVLAEQWEPQEASLQEMPGALSYCACVPGYPEVLLDAFLSLPPPSSVGGAEELSCLLLGEDHGVPASSHASRSYSGDSGGWLGAGP